MAGGREESLEPAAPPCGDMTTSRASQGPASCQTCRDTQLSHLASMGMRWPVTYKWEAAHADTCATWSHASKMISKKVGVILRMLASHAEDSPGCF